MIGKNILKVWPPTDREVTYKTDTYLDLSKNDDQELILSTEEELAACIRNIYKETFYRKNLNQVLSILSKTLDPATYILTGTSPLESSIYKRAYEMFMDAFICRSENSIKKKVESVKFGSDYRRKVTLEHETKWRKLFSYPARIHTDSKNVIYVVDSENATMAGKLLAIDRTGRLKFSYSGPSSFEQIQPSAVDVTPKDTIILLDYLNSALHVLNQKGILLAFQFLNDFSIETSDAMCIDNEGFLLIGCRGKGDENGKIHVMKIADRFI
ncbi:unnamed protein product [Mytilus edulis]|uniref:Uncharacterized protein n=1 Tax=Mytilus edulis TaxID=6550 RepID=A0A8S3THN6_MYTED|nr:unnamed protein product [Mytilus edulis]